MVELFDEDFDAIELAEGALILNKAIDPKTNDIWARNELQRLLKEVELTLSHEIGEQQRFDALLVFFTINGDFLDDQ